MEEMRPSRLDRASSPATSRRPPPHPRRVGCDDTAVAARSSEYRWGRFWTGLGELTIRNRLQDLGRTALGNFQG